VGVIVIYRDPNLYIQDLSLINVISFAFFVIFISFLYIKVRAIILLYFPNTFKNHHLLSFAIWQVFWLSVKVISFIFYLHFTK
jgi:hypothetical protein